MIACCAVRLGTSFAVHVAGGMAFGALAVLAVRGLRRRGNTPAPYGDEIDAPSQSEMPPETV